MMTAGLLSCDFANDLPCSKSAEMVIRLKFLLIALLLFLFVLGCNNIKPGDLTGTWVMTEASRQVLPAELQKTSATIILDANGTFVASEMPGLFYVPSRHVARLERAGAFGNLFRGRASNRYNLIFRKSEAGKTTFPMARSSRFLEEVCSTFLAMQTKGEEWRLKEGAGPGRPILRSRYLPFALPSFSGRTSPGDRNQCLESPIRIFSTLSARSPEAWVRARASPPLCPALHRNRPRRRLLARPEPFSAISCHDSKRPD